MEADSLLAMLASSQKRPQALGEKCGNCQDRLLRDQCEIVAMLEQQSTSSAMRLYDMCTLAALGAQSA